MSGTVSAGYVRLLVEAARSAGIAVDDLLPAGIDARLTDPDARLDRELSNRLWSEVAARSGDEWFGLHLAERARPGVFGVVDYAARNAPTLREAAQRFERYCRLVHDGAEVRVVEEPTAARIGYRLVSGRSPRHGAEFIAAAWVLIARQMTGVSLAPRLASFQHPRPASVDELVRVLGCTELRFDAAMNEIVLERSAFELPLAAADPALGALLDRYGAELLARLPRADSFDARLRQEVVLRGGEVGLSAIARALRMSARSLQRRLQTRGRTYQVLLDELRCELARAYLANPELAIGEAAFLLGFSEASAFHRAFKRWTGTTAGEFRRDALSQRRAST